jgi:hypothetical protein
VRPSAQELPVTIVIVYHEQHWPLRLKHVLAAEGRRTVHLIKWPHTIWEVVFVRVHQINSLGLESPLQGRFRNATQQVLPSSKTNAAGS